MPQISTTTYYEDNEDEVPLGTFDSAVPTTCLVLYGLSRFSGEAEVATAVRAYAPVTDVRLLRDAHGKSRGVAFVSFVNVEAATHTLATSKKSDGRGLVVDGARLTLAFSKGSLLNDAYVQQQLRQKRRRSPPRSRYRDEPYQRTRSRSPPSSGEEEVQRKIVPKKRDWPPIFEDDGAAFS